MKHPFWVIVLLLGIFFVQVNLSMRQKSATFDEVSYLPASYAYLVTGRLKMEPIQPPLSKVLYGMPLLLLNLKGPWEFASWRDPVVYGDPYIFGKEFLYHSGQDADKILLFGRLVSVLLAVILGWFVYVWSRDLYGAGPGLFSLFLYVFSVNIIAHSGLATTDIVLCCFALITMYYFWLLHKRPCGHGILLSGALLGLSLLTKLSAVILIPVLFVLSFVKFKHKLAVILPIALITFFTIWLGYGFEFGPALQPEETHPSAVKFLLNYFPPGRVPAVINLLEKTRLPFPSFFAGIVTFWPKRDTFFMGRNLLGAPWYGHIWAFLLKTPASLFVLILVSVLVFLRKSKIQRGDEKFLLYPVIGFFIMTMLRPISVQLRYLLPVYPFLFVFAGQVINSRPVRRLPVKLGLILICLWYVVSGLAAYPHYLAYFNEFAGGPANGYKYLVDSNLDWGQDLKLLKEYVTDNKIEKINLAYFGTAQPDYYKIKYKKLEPFQESSGWIGLSATFLQGAHTAKGGFDWLKKYEPVANLGHSIFIYNIKET